MRILQKRMFWLLLLLLFLLTGCRMKRNLPFYLLEDGSSIALTVDGARYMEDVSVITTWSSDVWNFTGKTGDAIGVCGGDNAEEGGGYDVCLVEGDEERAFLYVHTNHFVFGPYYTYFCIREDLQLTPPSVETVSRTGMVMTTDDHEVELTDPELVTALLDVYFGNAGKAGAGYAAIEGGTAFTLVFHHRDYPFLTGKIAGCKDMETGAAYMICADGVRRQLSEEQAERLTIPQ